MAKKKKRRRGKTIGEMCGSRVMWTIKPTTQVVGNGKKKRDRKKVREVLKSGGYNENE